MLYKYRVLKSSWGIVIYLDIQEFLNEPLLNSDVMIVEGIYLRIRDDAKLKKDDIVLWVGAGIKSIVEKIYGHVKTSTVCYEIRRLDFNNVDFQIEGLYCAIREWMAEYYKIKVDIIDVRFDSISNRYVFDIPKLSV